MVGLKTFCRWLVLLITQTRPPRTPPAALNLMLDLEFVEQIEKAHFRTRNDTGANLNALLIWNCVRKHVGLKPLTVEDLPAFCDTHNTVHIIRPDYNCKMREARGETQC